MTTIVSGTGLGLFNTSANLLGSAGNPSFGRPGQSDAVYINSVTGNLVVQREDDFLASVGVTTSLIRTYNSRGQFTDDNGDNWALNISALINRPANPNSAGSTVTKRFGDGAEVVYTFDTAKGLYVSFAGDGADDTLAFSSNQWTWTDGSARNTETYNSNGQLTGRRDRDGNLTTFAYTGNLLTSIADASGQTVFLDYTPNTNNVASIREVSQGVTQTLTRYGYDSSNRLTSVTVDLSPADNSISDGRTYVTTYTYDGTSKRVASITNGDGTKVSFTYVASDPETAKRIQTFTDGVGKIYTFEYAANNTLNITDPLNQVTSYVTNANGLLTQVQSPTVNGTRLSTSYEYDTRNNVTKVTDGNGKATISEYDASGNLTLTRDAEGNTVKFTYNSANQLLSETHYRGRDLDGSGPQQPTQPMTTRYVYDAENHLRFVISAEGRVRESRYDATGLLLTTVTYAADRYTTSGTPSEADMVTWRDEKKPDGTFKRDFTKTLLTEYINDFRGQVGKIRSYGQVNSNGGGVAGTQSETKFVYDQRGRLLQTIDPRGVANTPDPANPNLSYSTTYLYDGLGRVTSASQWIGNTETRTTLTAYDNATNKITTTLVNGLATTSVFDKRGLLLSVSQANGAVALGMTTYKYDDLGRLRITIDPLGNKTYALYDAAGRMVASIDASGALVESLYDNAGNLIKTIAYANRMTAAQLASLVDASGNPANVTLASVRPTANSANDRVTRNVYDAANRLVYIIVPHDTDPTKGFVTTNLYDGASRLTDVYRYANAISLTSLPAVPTPANVTALTTTSSDDRLTANTYDDDGNLKSIFERDGHAIDFIIDGAGQLVDENHRGLTSADDLHTYFFYNSKGERVASLDAENYLTEYAYDTAGNLNKTTRYYNKANPYTGTQTVAQLRPTVHANDAIAINDYNGEGKLTSVTENPAGTVTHFTYDNVGQLIKTERAWNTTEVRTTQTRYDVQGRVVQELTGEGSKTLEALGPNPQQALINGIWDQYSVRHTYDQAGRRLSTTDQNGNSTFFYYDENDRLRYTINSLGEVAETRYNTFGDVSETFSYHDRLSLWSNPTLRETSNTAAATAAQTAFDANGNGIAVWVLSTDLFYSTYTKATDSWSAPVTLDGTLTGSPSKPHLSMSANGNALVTWVQNNNIYARRFIASTGTWDGTSSTPLLVENASGAALNPAGTINDAGRAVVAFVQSDGTRNNVMVNTHNGTSWNTAALAIDDQGGANNNAIATSMVPSVTIDADGNAALLWLQKIGTETNNSLFYSRFNGSTWSNPSGTTLETNSAAITAAQIKFDASGNGVAVFVLNGTLFARSYTRSSNTWSSVFTNLGTTSGTPSLAMSANGKAIVAWKSDGDIRVRRYADGAWIGLSSELVEGSANPAFNPIASINEAGQAAVAFVQNDGTANHVFANRYTNGAWSGATAVEANANAASSTMAPSIAIDVDGNINALWLQKNGTETNDSVFSSRFSAGGKITAALSNAVDNLIQPRYNAHKTFNYTLRGAVKDAIESVSASTNLTTTYTYNAFGEVASRRDPVDMAGTVTTLTKYTYDRRGLLVQTVEDADALPWTSATLRETSNLATVVGVQTAFDAAGNGLAVWAQGADLFYSIYTKASDSWSSPANLDGSALGPGLPQLSMSGNGNALVTWAQNTNIYARRFIAGAWEAAPVLVENGSSPAVNPVGAINDAGRAVVAFVQSDGTRNNLMANTYNGTSWNTAALAIDDQGGANNNSIAGAMVPSVAIDPDGNAAVLWLQKIGTQTVDSLFYSRFTASSNSWSNPSGTVFEGDSNVVTAAQIKFDASGNGVAVWVQNAGLWARSYTKSSNTWSGAAPFLGNATGTPSLALDASGNGIVTWVSNGNVVARRYAGGNWLGAGAELIESAAGTVSNPVASINEAGQAVVAFVQNDGTANHVFANRYANAAWMGASALETNTNPVFGTMVPSAAIDAEGNINTLWLQRNGAETNDSVYSSRFNARSRVTTTTYDMFGRILRATDGKGNVTAFEYDKLGRTLKVALDPTTIVAANDNPTGLNLVTQYTYDAFDRKLKEIDALNNTIATFSYTDSTRSFTLTTAENVVVTTTLNRHGETDTVVDGNNIKTLYFYDKNGNLERTRAADGGLNLETKSTYDRADRVIKTIDARGVAIVLTYDAADRVLTRIVDPKTIDTPNDNPNGLDLKTSYTYDGIGRTIKVTDERGNATTFTHDAKGNLEATYVFGVGISTKYTYDAQGHVLTEARGELNSEKQLTRYVYDKLGRRIETHVDPNGLNLTTKYVYDKNDNVTKVIDAAGGVTRYYYDDADRLIYALDPTGGLTQKAYDANGRVLKEIHYASALSNGSFTKTDIDTRVSQIADAARDLVARFVYDKDGREVYRINALGEVTQNTFDKNGNVVKTVRYGVRISIPTTPDTTNMPTAISNAVSAAGANAFPNVVESSVFDAVNRKTYCFNASGEVTQYDYDKNGNVVKTIRYAKRIDPATAASESAIRTALGTAALSDVNNVCIYAAYDNANRQVYGFTATLAFGETTAKGELIENVFDANGNVAKTIRYAKRITIPATVDATTIGNAKSADPSNDQVLHSVYDAANRLTYTVNVMGEVAKIVYDANSNVIERVAYATRISMSSWTPGNPPAPTSDTIHDRRVRMIYDGANRVRLTVTDVIGNENRVAVVEQLYDGNGNVKDRFEYAKDIVVPASTAMTVAAVTALLQKDTSVDKHVQMVYDTANRLTSIIESPMQTMLDYDALGNVVKRKELHSSSTNDRITVFTFDAANRQIFTVDALGGVVRQLYDTNGNVIQRFAYANTITPPTYQGTYTTAIIQGQVTTNGNDRASYALYDAANRATTQVNALGNVTSTIYDAFGNSVTTTAYAKSISLSSVTANNARSTIPPLIVADTTNDRVTKRKFDAAGRLLASMNGLGFVTGTVYNTTGTIAKTTDYYNAMATSTTYSDIDKVIGNIQYDHTASFGYDRAGRLQTSTDALGYGEFYDYDGVGNRKTFRNKKLVEWTYDYDSAGRMTKETSPQVSLTTLSQTGDGSLSYTTATGSVVTKLTYDARGNLKSRTEAFGRPEARTTQYVYDSVGRQVKTIFPSVGVYDAANDDLRTNGASSLAARKETVKELFAEITYDSLGNAISGLDAAGNRSYKTYDKLGHVTYEFDAEGGVSGHSYNTFGEEVGLTRYATAQPTMLTGTGQTSLTAAQIALLAGAGDRTLQTTRDFLGRVSTVVEPSAFVYDPTLASGQTFTAGKTTVTTYNAFGEIFQQRVLKSTPSTYNYVITNYYDKAGRLIQQVDALGYVTKQEFDPFGNVTKRSEFETAISWDGSTAKVTDAPPSAPTGAARVTEYNYDYLNRKTSMTRKNIEVIDETKTTNHKTPGTTGVFTTTADLMTTYGYDAVGNLVRTTEPTGTGTDTAITYTYYDALGRVRATAAPKRDAVVDPFDQFLETPISGNPLTEFRNDAFGNVVAKLDYKFGASAADESGYTLKQSSAGTTPSRATLTKYDALGHATQTTDAGNINHYASYNALGNLAKSWQTVTQLTSYGDVPTMGPRTSYQVFKYDKVGRQTQMIEPPSTADLAPGQPLRYIATSYIPNPPSGFTDRLTVYWTGVIDFNGRPVRVSFPVTIGSNTTTISQTFADPSLIAKSANVDWNDNGTGTIGQVKVEQQAQDGSWVQLWPGNGPFQPTTTYTTYNTFGETTSKLVISAGAVAGSESFEYDGAGRLFRTNSGDGVDKIFLYDLQGNRTSEIRSGGQGSFTNNVDLKTIGSASAANALTHVRRTDYYYDALGRVTKEVQPERETTAIDVKASDILLTMDAVAVSATPTVISQNPLKATWSGFSQKDLKVDLAALRSAYGLAELGGGDLIVELKYRTASYQIPGGPYHTGVERTRTFTLPSVEQDEVMQLRWTDPEGPDGGIDFVINAKIYKQGVSGDKALIGELGPSFPAKSRLPGLRLTAPNDGTPRVSFVLSQNGSPIQHYFFDSIFNGFGSALFVDIWQAPGTYQYTVTAEQPSGNRNVGTGTVTITQDAQGFKSVQVTPATTEGTPFPRPVVNKTYDRWGNMLSLTDARAATLVTSYTYNADNKVTRITLPAKTFSEDVPEVPSTQLLYDKAGRLAGTVQRRKSSSNGTVRVYDYNVNTNKYDAGGNLIAEDDAEDYITKHSYNFFGEKVKTVDKNGYARPSDPEKDHATYFDYDTMGRLIKTSRPSVIEGLDGFGKSSPQTKVHPRVVETIAYDEMGNRVSVTNGAGEITRYRYDLTRHLTKSEVPITSTLAQSTYVYYDALGHKLAEQDANGNIAVWKYDYLGRLIRHTDIGGAVYDYTYDNAGNLVSEKNTRGKDVTYDYDAAGQLRRALNKSFALSADFQSTRYKYDLAGHRTSEITEANGTFYQYNFMEYDKWGRLSRTSDTRANTQIEYDMAGNRSRISTTLKNRDQSVNQNRYFAYDRMNRMIVADGIAAGNQPTLAVLGQTGHFFAYDGNGNRISDIHWDERPIYRTQGTQLVGYDKLGRAMYSNTIYGNPGGSPGQLVPALYTEHYRYNGLNQLEAVLGGDTAQAGGVLLDYRSYDDAGRLLTTGPNIDNPVAYASLITGDNNGVVDGMEARINTYDQSGKLKTQTVKDGLNPTTVKYVIRYDYADSYDAIGNLKKYTLENKQGTAYTNTYVYDVRTNLGDGYRVNTISGSTTPGGVFNPGTTTYSYDRAGNVIGLSSSTMTEDNRTIVNDIDGRALYEAQNGNVQRQLIVNGQWMGRYGKGIDEAKPRDSNQKPLFKDIADFNFSYQLIGANAPAATPGAYTVRAGDTLPAIAQAAYGDASLWYIIADANGLSGSEALTPGQVLMIPNRVVTAHNSFTDFKPYDPTKIPGDPTPFLPKASGSGGCGGWGYILAVVVAVAVAVAITALTAGIAAAPLAALIGGGLLGTIVAGAIVGAAGAAVGSIASQLILVGTGADNGKGFRWSEVGKSAIFGAAAGALTALAAPATKEFTELATKGGTFGDRAAGTLMLALEQAEVAGLANMAGQGGAMALGQQKKFDWNRVAFAAVGGGVGSLVYTATNGALQNMSSGFFKDLISNSAKYMAANTAVAETRIAITGGGKIDWRQVAADAFGNALGRSIGDSYSRMQAEERLARELARKAEFERQSQLQQTLALRLSEPRLKVTDEILSRPFPSPERTLRHLVRDEQDMFNWPQTVNGFVDAPAYRESRFLLNAPSPRSEFPEVWLNRGRSAPVPTVNEDSLVAPLDLDSISVPRSSGMFESPLSLQPQDFNLRLGEFALAIPPIDFQSGPLSLSGMAGPDSLDPYVNIQQDVADMAIRKSSGTSWSSTRAFRESFLLPWTSKSIPGYGWVHQAPGADGEFGGYVLDRWIDPNSREPRQGPRQSIADTIKANQYKHVNLITSDYDLMKPIKGGFRLVNPVIDRKWDRLADPVFGNVKDDTLRIFAGVDVDYLTTGRLRNQFFSSVNPRDLDAGDKKGYLTPPNVWDAFFEGYAKLQATYFVADYQIRDGVLLNSANLTVGSSVEALLEAGIRPSLGYAKANIGAEAVALKIHGDFSARRIEFGPLIGVTIGGNVDVNLGAIGGQVGAGVAWGGSNGVRVMGELGASMGAGVRTSWVTTLDSPFLKAVDSLWTFTKQLYTARPGASPMYYGMPKPF